MACELYLNKKERAKLCYTNAKKKPGVLIIISDYVEFKTKSIIQERCVIMLKHAV